MVFHSSRVYRIELEKGNRVLRATGNILIDIQGFVLHNKSWSFRPLWIAVTFLLEFAWLRATKRAGTFWWQLAFAALFARGVLLVIVSMALHPSFPRKSVTHQYRRAAIEVSTFRRSSIVTAAYIIIGMIVLVSLFMLILVIVCHLFLFFALDPSTRELIWSRMTIILTGILILSLAWFFVCL
jgi:hypothetical protein